MPANRTTKFYFLLLVLNITAGSFFLLLILDAAQGSMTYTRSTRGDSLTIASLLWPPLSVTISLILLKYWVNVTSKPPTSFLPVFNSKELESEDVDVLLGRKMVLLAFLHKLLMLSRLLACKYHFYGIQTVLATTYHCCRYFPRMQVSLLCPNATRLDLLCPSKLGTHRDSMGSGFHLYLQSMPHCVQYQHRPLGLLPLPLPVCPFPVESYCRYHWCFYEHISCNPRVDSAFPDNLGISIRGAGSSCREGCSYCN